MAATQLLVGRSSMAENVIKQGYLKRSVRSSDIILSTTKQIATNIKQKLEPSRWYVFGVRFGVPYLEYFESEERVFTGSPLETFDLSSYRNITYTLGRTNTSFTFCIFLEDRTIELTASNRAQMLDWCRNLERHLRNLGIGNKKAKDDHTYSAFPVQPKPVQRSLLDSLEGATGGEPNENIYEDAEDYGTQVKSSGRASQCVPPLPPRPQKPGEEDVFASLYSVKKLPDNDYNNVDRIDAESVSFVRDNLLNFDETDTLKVDRVGMETSDLVDLGQRDSDAENEDRCVSLPVLPSKHTELDSSEDSDFVSASFWLRNRKLDEMKSHDDSELETGKRKHPLISCVQNDQVPPLPLRTRSLKPRSGRNCLSMNCDFQLNKYDKNTAAAFYQTPVPKSGVNTDSKQDGKHNIHEHHPTQSESCKLPRVKEFDSNVLKPENEFQDSIDKRTENGATDDGEYEAVVNPKPVIRQKTETDDCAVYETTWGNKGCGEKCNEMEYKSSKSPKKENNTGFESDSQPKLPPRKGLSKLLGFKKNQPLPDELVVSLPPRETSNSRSGNESEEKDTGPSDGNLYSDFPESVDAEKVKSNTGRPVGFDSDILKMSAQEQKLEEQLGLVLPKRNLRKGAVSVKATSSEKALVVKSALTQSVSESRQGLYAVEKSSKKTNGQDPFSDYLQPQSVYISKVPNGQLLEDLDSQPVAPPRRNRNKSQDYLERQGTSVQGPHKTVIQLNSFDSAPTLPIRNVSLPSTSSDSGEPPLPPRFDSLPQRLMSSWAAEDSIPEHQAPPVPREDSSPDRLAQPLPSMDTPPDRPAPPPPRRNIIRSQSDTASAEPPAVGARPKTVYHVTRQTSHVGMNLKQNQVDIVRAERESTGGMVRSIPKVHFLSGLALVQCFDAIWIAGWDVKKYPRLYDKFHIGDELIAVNDVNVEDLAFANKLVKNLKVDHVEVTVRRLPNARIFAIQRSQEGESLGIKRDGGTAEIVYVDPNGLAAQHGLSSKANTMSGGALCNWTLTEINMRPLNLFFKDSEIEHRLLAVGKDISIVVQPSDFIKELKKQLKKLRGFKDFIVQ